MALTEEQQALLSAWLPGARVIADLSWGLIGTTVLELEQSGGRFIAKAEDAAGHHLQREITAHRCWLSPWTSTGRAPVLVAADRAAKLLVTRYLPGELVQGHPAEHDRGTHRQAGALLARFHGQCAEQDERYEADRRDQALAALDRPHRIPGEVAARLRAEMVDWPTPPVAVVPTHGDWQPRNWLIHDGEVRVIDLGRAGLRPAATDFVRLATRQWAGRPALEAAFLAGYGGDPREPGVWRRMRVAEAIGVATWAHDVGDRAFEQEGLDEIERLLEEGAR